MDEGLLCGGLSWLHVVICEMRVLYDSLPCLLKVPTVCKVRARTLDFFIMIIICWFLIRTVSLNSLTCIFREETINLPKSCTRKVHCWVSHSYEMFAFESYYIFV